MVRPSLVLFATLLLSVTTANAQHHYSEAERRIVTLVDERRAPDSVAMYLHDRDPDVAWRAAVGLANLRDTSIRHLLVHAISLERRDTVIDAEAFALGVLGESESASNVLIAKAASRPSIEVMRALGRTAPSSADVSQYFVTQASNPAIHVPLAAMVVEFGLRQHYSDALGKLVDALAESNDAQARWRAAYMFSRLKDSTAISQHLRILRELLQDQGSDYARMFAATAIGRLGNSESTRILETALKSEPGWRVRINLYNALTHAPAFDSTIFRELRKTVDGAVNDSDVRINVATSALRSLDQMIVSGKLSKRDSDRVGRWISEYNGTMPEHSDVSKLVQATATIMSARLQAPNYRLGIENFAQTRDYVLRNLAIEAASLVKDTFYFGGILVSMPVSSPKEQLNRLDGLASLWKLAKSDTSFMAELESAQLADIYRHLVLHLGEVALEPEVIIPSLAAWTDTTIINSKERRIEADTLIAKYMLSYMTPQHRDELVAAVSDVIWLGDTSPELSKMLSKAVNFAAKSSDKELLDSLQRAYTVLHLPWPGTKLAPIQSNIDWKTLESLPNSLLINFTNEQVIMDLLPYYAPVTTLKMVQLARIQYFANQAFHRVVPNFVVQTGDPTGSGWGGPGYMMRTEIAPIAYDEAGLVGMASSGLNTEGSQWFVTECPTPHLSTRYTIWGRMRTGMDKIYRIQLGEKIETIMPYTTK